MSNSVMDGIVIQAGGGVYHVATETGPLVCTLRGRLSEVQNIVALAERVVVADLGDGRGVIEDVRPRTSVFSRRAAGRRGVEQVIAVNIDQVVVVFAAADPELKENALDRYLAVAEHCGVPAVIVVNKIDLVDRGCIQERVAVYRNIGYPVLLASADTGEGVADIRAALAEHISILVGPSGVGKSSLANAVEPGLELATCEVGSGTHKGKHTTTSARLFPLGCGGYLADTPGMREFGFWKIPDSDLAACFREMRPLVGQCRFANCSHLSEPGCAIRAAVDAGQVDRRRYEHFTRLTRGS